MPAEALQAEHLLTMGSKRVQEQAGESVKHAEALANELEDGQLPTPATACQEHVPGWHSEISKLPSPQNRLFIFSDREIEQEAGSHSRAEQCQSSSPDIR